MFHLRSTFRTLAVASLTLALTASLIAGPPTVCHPIQTPAGAEMLPAGQNRDIDPSYDRTRLVTDTLAILTPDQDVLVRMETLRRATLYVPDDPRTAFQLWSALQSRVLEAEANNEANAMAWFDAGYLAQTYAQLGAFNNLGMKMPSGYEWVVRARTLETDPEQGAKIDFALALMTSYLKVPGKKWAQHRNYEDHLRAAVTHAKADSPLGRNLSSNFGRDIKKLKLAYAGSRG